MNKIKHFAPLILLLSAYSCQSFFMHMTGIKQPHPVTNGEILASAKDFGIELENIYKIDTMRIVFEKETPSPSKILCSLFRSNSFLQTKIYRFILSIAALAGCPISNGIAYILSTPTRHLCSISMRSIIEKRLAAIPCFTFR
jgi:hypothetical protein